MVTHIMYMYLGTCMLHGHRLTVGDSRHKHVLRNVHCPSVAEGISIIHVASFS